MLSQLKILDFSSLLPGPYASMIFADLGADVLRVESPYRVDLIRTVPPLVGEDSAVHKQLNRSKKSIALDLKQSESIAIIERLVSEYDIVLEQFRPGVMERLGLGYETLSQINPRLIYCSLTGYGQSGPFRDRPGHDINYLALSGLLGYSGRKASGPTPFGSQIADLAGGSLHAVIGILTAVIHRERTGIGQHIDISMTDGTFALNVMYGSGYLTSGLHPEREETMLNGGSFYDYYETKDGRYVAVGSIEPPFRHALCKAIGREDLLELSVSDDPHESLRLKEACKEAFKAKTWDEWQKIFSDKHACVEPVLSFAEACEHPHFQQRDMVVSVPRLDGPPLKQFAHPIQYSAYTPAYKYVAGRVGEQTREVLVELGYSDDEIDELQQKGAITCTNHRSHE